MTFFLETPHLTLRRFTEADLDRLHALDSDPVVMRYVIPPRTFEQTQAYLRSILDDYEKMPQTGRWVVSEKNGPDFVGVVVLKKLEGTDEDEIGYRFFQEFWGKGYATEGMRALIDYAFGVLGLPRVVAVAHPDNGASWRVMEKCGMHFGRLAHFYNTEVKYYVLENPVFTTR